MYPYKIQRIHALQPNDRPAREAFARTVLLRLVDDCSYLSRICFSDEATFHVCGMVNRHNVRIWGRENPTEVLEVERNSPKVNVWCGLTNDMVIGPFFFNEPTITATTYLDMLENFVFPQLEYRQPASQLTYL